MTIDEAFGQFQDAANELSNFTVLQGRLLQQLDNVAAGIAARAPIRTGNLRNSIKFLIEQTEGADVSIALQMATYGWFLNYGVQGIRNTTRQESVPEALQAVLPPSQGNTFKFGVNPAGKHYWGIHYPGINKRGFLNVEELQTQIADIAAEQITQIFTQE